MATNVTPDASALSFSSNLCSTTSFSATLWKKETKPENVVHSCKLSSSVVFLHRHHSLERMSVKEVLLRLSSASIVKACCRPTLFKLPYVIHFSHSKLKGSLKPGANACRIKITSAFTIKTAVDRLSFAAAQTGTNRQMRIPIK